MKMEFICKKLAGQIFFEWIIAKQFHKLGSERVKDRTSLIG